MTTTGTRTRDAATAANQQARLAALAHAALGCTGCDLYLRATQTVFGAGPARAQVVMVGEQPGDREDLDGLPFVGPAGHELDKAMAEAGLERGRVYLTNAVKHFRWIPRGKKRIHQQPNRAEIRACRPWLEDELALVEPEVLVLLGAVATQSLLGFDARISDLRGRWIETSWAPNTLVTAHPSSVLRERDSMARQAAHDALVADLRKVPERLGASAHR